MKSRTSIKTDVEYLLKALLLLCTVLAVGTATADNANTRTSHGLTLYGKLKYGSGFKHFDFVNPEDSTSAS